MEGSYLPSRGTAGLPGRPSESTNLADILERVLDKGIVIAGDIQINLLDIELLTIKLRLLIASVDRARETVQDLTGYPPESVSGLQWDGETWLVTVDVCELERVPSTTDLLATYVVQLDDSGGLLGYKRTKRFVRGQAEEE